MVHGNPPGGLWATLKVVRGNPPGGPRATLQVVHVATLQVVRGNPPGGPRGNPPGGPWQPSRWSTWQPSRWSTWQPSRWSVATLQVVHEQPSRWSVATQQVVCSNLPGGPWVTGSSKTEVLWLTLSRWLINLTQRLQVVLGGVGIQLSDEVRSLGVVIDPFVTFASHVSRVARTSYYHLRQVRSVRQSLTVDSCHALVRALVISRL